MYRRSVVIVIAILLLALGCARGDESSETTNVTTRTVEPAEIPGYIDDEVDIDFGDAKRSDLYKSRWEKLDSLVVEGGASIPDDLFGGNKRINVYKHDDSPDKVFIEFGDPYFSPYINAVQINAVTLFAVYSDGTEELIYEGTLAPGVEGSMHETTLLTYEFDKPEGFLDTPASRMLLDMTYNIEGYGTGKMQADLWIEP